MTAGLAVDVSLDDLRTGNVRLRRGATGTSGLPSYPCSLCSRPLVRGQRFVVVTPYPYLGPPTIAHLEHIPALRRRQLPELSEDGWTHPVAGPAGLTPSEAQAAHEASQAHLDPAERSGPGYTEPPLDWEPERETGL